MRESILRLAKIQEEEALQDEQDALEHARAGVVAYGGDLNDQVKYDGLGGDAATRIGTVGPDGEEYEEEPLDEGVRYRYVVGGEGSEDEEEEVSDFFHSFEGEGREEGGSPDLTSACLFRLVRFVRSHRRSPKEHQASIKLLSSTPRRSSRKPTSTTGRSSIRTRRRGGPRPGKLSSSRRVSSSFYFALST